MEQFDILQDVAQRTGGDIYIGVVGPVRSGKSTLIRRIMELAVLPNISDANEQARARDAMPQGGTGRQVMTTEPKFIPDEGVEIALQEGMHCRIRMVDCVGYAVDGAIGYTEDEAPRMVDTPWFDHPVPFAEAAQTGTRRVIAEHSTIGIVVGTDGSVTGLPRAAYEPAEAQVVAELTELGKPFVVVLNSAHPYAQETLEMAHELEERYGVPVLPLSAQDLTSEDLQVLLEQLLYEFPVREVAIALPDWVQELASGYPLRDRFESAVREAQAGIHRVRDVDSAVDQLSAFELADRVQLTELDLGEGVAHIALSARPGLFFQTLTDLYGEPIAGEPDLMRAWQGMVVAKRGYEQVAEALDQVHETGYGLVAPRLDQMAFEEPELIKMGNRFGVRLRAAAPSIHMIRADIETEVTPIIGTERQSEELVQYLLTKFEDDPRKIWESDIFGKSLNELVREGIQNKLVRMPEQAQQKLRETLERIVNEGSGGLICIIV